MTSMTFAIAHKWGPFLSFLLPPCFQGFGVALNRLHRSSPSLRGKRGVGWVEIVTFFLDATVREGTSLDPAADTSSCVQY